VRVLVCRLSDLKIHLCQKFRRQLRKGNIVSLKEQRVNCSLEQPWARNVP